MRTFPNVCMRKCYVLHVIYKFSSLDCILKTGESWRNYCAYAVTRAGGGGGCSGVSDPACPGTTMVSRRWVTSTIAQPRICRPRSNTGELQLLWPAPLHLNCQLSTLAAASKLGRSTSSQWPLLFIPQVLSCRKILEFLVPSITFALKGSEFALNFCHQNENCTTFIFFNAMVTV